MSKNTLEDIVYPAVDEIKHVLPEGAKLHRSPETVLFGNGAVLDSINLVNFILAVEERAEAVTGRQIRLVTENAMSRSKSPFKTLQTISDYVDELMQEPAK